MGYFKDKVISLLSETDKPNFVRQVNRGGTWCNIPVWKSIITTNRSSQHFHEKWFKDGIKAIRKQKQHRKNRYGLKYFKQNESIY